MFGCQNELVANRQQSHAQHVIIKFNLIDNVVCAFRNESTSTIDTLGSVTERSISEE